ncbi:hypothetical protein HYPSUDRAFT_43171 [Hypholoma sublateritium FD-334 SS-4]|uniref:Major facilitator superfamily (MFS) profile domain-containing protein n=1 Tax=Hypholoma sublateritium (strain FD-334 SS-4) TaxID=945553 RepID=A0A0D2NVA3_HYPSF|nr:hypothetical protein HYPSUDRAFT_43171 [Hypholoma sublateritium FD-334 SS-4]
MAVAGAALIQFCGFGYTNSFGVYQDYYTRIYITNASSSAISWIGSVNAFLVIVSGLWAGILYDRGYFYYLLYGGSILISFSLFMLSLTKPDHLWQNFLAQGVGIGLGAGMMYVPSIAVLSQYFSRRRTLAMTIVASGSSFGAIIHPIMLNNLFASRLGFQKSVRISAGFVSVVLFAACFLLRPRFVAGPVKKPPLHKSLRKFYSQWSFTAISLGGFFFPVGLYFPIFYIQLDAIKHGLSKSFAFYVLVILNACSFIGRLAPGPFIYTIGVIRMITFASLGCSVLIFGIIGLSGVGSVIPLAILYGFFAGVFVSLQSPLVAVLTEDMSELGARLGVAFTFCAFGSLIGPPIQGALLTDKFIWWRPALVSGLFSLVGTVAFASILLTSKRARAG